MTCVPHQVRMYGNSYCMYVCCEYNFTMCFFSSSGYDSVEGEPGEDLNYDEVVVYNNDQAVPSYLIIYSLPVRDG